MVIDKPRLLIYSHAERLGDALLKLPALSVLREAFPGHHITWLAGCQKSAYRDLLQALVKDFLDEIIDNAGIGQSVLEFIKPVPLQTPYDIIIDTQNTIKSTLAIKRIPHNLFISPAGGFIFSDIKPPDKKLYKRGSVQDRLLFLFGLCSGRKLHHHYQLRLPRKYLHAAGRLLPAGQLYIGLAPGAGGAEKCWPLENYISTAENQVRQGRVPVFFLGPEEQTWITTIKTRVPAALFPEQENQSSSTTGPLLALGLAKRVRVAVANDSGAGHILATAEVPLVSLFGPTDSRKFAVGGGKSIIITAGPPGESNMARISIQSVNHAINELLS